MRVPTYRLRHRCSGNIIRVNQTDYERDFAKKYRDYERVGEENTDMLGAIEIVTPQIVDPAGIPVQSQPASSPETEPEPETESDSDAEKQAAIDAGIQGMSRRELDEQARQLGIPVQDHWYDETVRRKIAEKLAE